MAHERPDDVRLAEPETEDVFLPAGEEEGRLSAVPRLRGEFVPRSRRDRDRNVVPVSVAESGGGCSVAVMRDAFKNRNDRRRKAANAPERERCRSLSVAPGYCDFGGPLARDIGGGNRRL